MLYKSLSSLWVASKCYSVIIIGHATLPLSLEEGAPRLWCQKRLHTKEEDKNVCLSLPHTHTHTHTKDDKQR